MQALKSYLQQIKKIPLLSADEELQLALKRARDRYTSRKQVADYTALLEKENAETSQQLIKSIEFQRNLTESAMDGILACDMEGNILSFNKSMERISGYSRDAVINKLSLDRLLTGKEEKRLRAALRGDGYGGKNRLSLFVNGSPVPLTIFPRQIIASVLLALGSSLKGVKDIGSMDVHLRQ